MPRDWKLFWNLYFLSKDRPPPSVGTTLITFTISFTYPGSGRSPGVGNGNPLQYSVFLPGQFYGQKSLVGYSPRGCKESDTTEHACTQGQVVCWYFLLFAESSSFWPPNVRRTPGFSILTSFSIYTLFQCFLWSLRTLNDKYNICKSIVHLQISSLHDHWFLYPLMSPASLLAVNCILF